jgi:hypothetical protein
MDGLEGVDYLAGIALRVNASAVKLVRFVFLCFILAECSPPEVDEHLQR